VTNGITAALGDHAIYLELLVGVAGFEPAASSSRTHFMRSNLFRLASPITAKLLVKGPVLMSNGDGGCRSAETAGQQTEAGQD